MNAQRQFFDFYVQDRRVQQLELFSLEDLGYLIRYTPTAHSTTDGLVAFCCASSQEIESKIKEQIEYFRSVGKSFEWKVYDFDEPKDLKEILAAQGFICDEPEVFMVYSTAKPVNHMGSPGHCTIVRIESEQGVADVVAVQEKVWDRKFEWLPDQLMASLTSYPDKISIYCAYIDGVPVGTGWTDFPIGSKFPELHGGAVIPEIRGRGIYKALYGIRISEAAKRGYENIVVDASPMSRPILEKLGFVHVCNTFPMRYDVA